MKLNFSISKLKQQAKSLKRSQGLTMVAALDQVAQTQGYNSWSLLHAKTAQNMPTTADEILKLLNPSDLLLITARPNLGKTKLAMQVLVNALQQGRSCFFFSFEFTEIKAIAKFNEIDSRFDQHHAQIHLDFSDKISAEYIIEACRKRVNISSVIVIDYLQLLDQQRSKPPVQQQVEALKVFAKNTGCIIIFISQIDRNAEEDKAGLQDVRLPNPLDMSLFDKSIFL